MNKFDFDVDIDLADRSTFLNNVAHTPASIEKDGKYTKHNTGVYFQNIPVFPLDGFASIDHKQAEQEGWFKVDFLNNSVYKKIKSEQHLMSLLETEPLWELLEDSEFVKLLFHIANYSNIVNAYKPKSVEELAMILAIIRPGKKHLVGKSFEEIGKSVWEKPEENNVYYFKKSHAIAYALTVIVQMNMICEDISYGYS
jgi:DNA polymerase III alpha subunit